MSSLFHNVTLIEKKHDTSTAAFFTFETHDGEKIIIANCHEKKGPLLHDTHLRIFWGGYERRDDEGLSHWVNAFVYQYQDYYDVVVLDE